MPPRLSPNHQTKRAQAIDAIRAGLRVRRQRIPMAIVQLDGGEHRVIDSDVLQHHVACPDNGGDDDGRVASGRKIDDLRDEERPEHVRLVLQHRVN